MGFLRQNIFNLMGLKEKTATIKEGYPKIMVTVSHYTVGTVHLMGNIYYSKSQGRGEERNYIEGRLVTIHGLWDTAYFLETLGSHSTL